MLTKNDFDLYLQLKDTYEKAICDLAIEHTKLFDYPKFGKYSLDGIEIEGEIVIVYYTDEKYREDCTISFPTSYLFIDNWKQIEQERREEEKRVREESQKKLEEERAFQKEIGEKDLYERLKKKYG